MPPSGFRIYDTHTHLGTARHSGRRQSAEDLLRDMDRLAIERAVVIPFSVVEDYRAAHDEIGRAVQQHPDRLRGAACIYPFIPESDFRGEVRRCREIYGFRALKHQPQYQALNPLSPRTEFLFEAALANQLALIVHTGAGAPFALPSLYMPAARKYPGLKVILAHCGGGLYAAEATVAALFCPNIYLELSSLMPHHIVEVMNHVPASRLMIGSDLPVSQEAEIGKILSMPLPVDEKRSILFDTAEAVFG